MTIIKFKSTVPEQLLCSLCNSINESIYRNTNLVYCSKCNDEIINVVCEKDNLLTEIIENYIIYCPNELQGCADTFIYKNKKYHLDNECMFEYKKCGNVNAGCDYKEIKKDYLHDNCPYTDVNDTASLKNKIEELNDKVVLLKKDNEELNNKVVLLKKDNEELNDKVDLLKKDNEELNDKVVLLKKDNEELNDKITSLKNRTNSAINTINSLVKEIYYCPIVFENIRMYFLHKLKENVYDKYIKNSWYNYTFKPGNNVQILTYPEGIRRVIPIEAIGCNDIIIDDEEFWINTEDKLRRDSVGNICRDVHSFEIKSITYDFYLYYLTYTIGRFDVKNTGRGEEYLNKKLEYDDISYQIRNEEEFPEKYIFRDFNIDNLLMFIKLYYANPSIIKQDILFLNIMEITERDLKLLEEHKDFIEQFNNEINREWNITLRGIEIVNEETLDIYYSHLNNKYNFIHIKHYQ